MVRNAKMYANRTAIFDDDASYSHRDLLNRCAVIGEALKRAGVRRQDRVAFLFGNNMDAVVMFGVAELYGFIGVPLNWRLSALELIETVADCRPTAFIFQADLAHLAEPIASSAAAPGIILSSAPCDFAGSLEAEIASVPPFEAVSHARQEDIAFIIYTSGSSGKPKGVMLSQRNQMASVRIMSAEMRLAADDRGYISMPLFHVGARLYQSAVALSGGCAYIESRFEPERALSAMQTHRLTFAPLVPTMVERLVNFEQFGDFDLSSMRMFLYTGAAMPGPVIRRGIELLGPRFHQMYGQTENCGGASLYPHQHAIGGERGERILGAVGQAGAYASIAIVDENDHPVAQGEVGEVLISSDANMVGYWNNSVATAETLRNGWVYTGDLGRFDEEGFLFIVGRKKDMIISGGENIFAGEVEQALEKHAAVGQASVIGIPDAKWGETVKAFVILKDGHAVTSEALAAHCTGLIANYKQPRVIEFVFALPLNPVGKVDKLALRALNGAPLDA